MKIDKKIIEELVGYLKEFNLSEVEYAEETTKVRVSRSKNNPGIISTQINKKQTLHHEVVETYFLITYQVFQYPALNRTPSPLVISIGNRQLKNSFNQLFSIPPIIMRHPFPSLQFFCKQKREDNSTPYKPSVVCPIIN